MGLVYLYSPLSGNIPQVGTSYTRKPLEYDRLRVYERVRILKVELYEG